MIWAFQAIFDLNLPADQVDKPSMDKMGGNTARATFMQIDRFLLNPRQTANARSDRTASAQLFCLTHVCKASIFQCLTGSIDPEEGMRRCIANYERRATHPTFKALRSTDAGGRYNALFIDLALAAIMKKRGLVSGSVHDWRWG